MRLTTPSDSNHACDSQESKDRGAIPLPAAGSDDDPVMREALRLIQAFLAIEDADARNALVTLAESLVSYDWVRKAQRR